MAVVRTTSTVPDEPDPRALPIDRTKSVVARPAARVVARQPGRPMAQNRAQTVGQAAAPRDFINDTVTELKRVVWPTREEVRSGTIVTVGLLVLFGIYIAGLDAVAGWFFHAIGAYGAK